MSNDFYALKPFGLIPSDWDHATIGDVFSVQLGKMLSDKSKVGTHPKPYLGNSNVQWGRFRLNNLLEMDFFPTEQAKFALAKGDILVCEGGEVGRTAIWQAEMDECYYQKALHRLRPKSNRIESEFFRYFMEDACRKNLFRAYTGTSSIPHLTRETLIQLKLPIPPHPEQQKIAAILSTWDRAIELTEKLIAAKQKRKQALMQQLLTSRRAKRAKLASVVQRVNDPIIPEPDMMYREIGIRSHGKGIFHKEAVTGRSLGNKRVYRVHADCFVFNVVFAWEQAIAKTTSTESDMIASHRFPMYEPINNMIDLDYLLYFFKMPRGKHLLGLASPGGAGRNRTLSQAGFLKTRIPLPPIDEQKRISAILTKADSELRLLERQRENFCLQKKGLMQQLLTGKVRVNVDAETVKG